MSQISSSCPEQVLTLDRRTKERREDSGPDAKLERRKQPRRRQIDPTTCERDYTNQEIEFMQAMDEYKRVAGRMFPTCSEVLEVLRSLGYVQLTAKQRQALELDDQTDTESLVL